MNHLLFWMLSILSILVCCFGQDNDNRVYGKDLKPNQNEPISDVDDSSIVINDQDMINNDDNNDNDNSFNLNQLFVATVIFVFICILSIISFGMCKWAFCNKYDKSKIKSTKLNV